MILTSKYNVGDVVRVTDAPNSPDLTITEVVVGYGVESNGRVSHWQDDQLTLVKRVCNHIRGYYPEGREMTPSKAYRFCPDCGERLAQ